MRPHAVKRSARQCGAAAVELALLTALLLLPMTLIGLEGGRVFFTYNTLVKSVRDAVRHLSEISPVDPNYATALGEAKCLAVYGNTACSGGPLAPALSLDMVGVCDSGQCTAGDCNPPGYSGSSTGVASCRSQLSSSNVVNLVRVRIGIPGHQYQLTTLFGGGGNWFFPTDPATILFGRDISATMEQAP